MTRTFHKALAVFALAISAASCESGTGPDLTPHNVAVSGPSAPLWHEASIQLTATVRNRSNDPLPGLEVEWESANPSIATVTSSGLVTGVALGATVIRAKYGDVFGVFGISVVPHNCTPTSSAGTITLGANYSGSINTDDCNYNFLWRGEARTLSVAVPDTFLVRYSATSGSVLLHVIDAAADTVLTGGSIVSAGDTAYNIVSLPAGVFRIWMLAPRDTTSNYSVHVSTVNLCDAGNALGSIAVGATAGGTLSTASCLTNWLAPAGAYTFSLDTASTVRFDMRSSSFEPLIRIFDAGGTAVSYGDALSADSATAIDRLDAGTYVVWATSGSGSVGAYTLRRSDAVLPPCDTPTDTIAIGETINSTLAITDCDWQPSFRADSYMLTVSDTTTVRIDLTSATLDTYLNLYRGAWMSVASNDNGGGGTNARITETLEPGTYLIIVSAIGLPNSGYSLSVQVVP
jgi:hypothetical protein